MKRKLVVLTGAGVSAESGISTFRDSDGLWENYKVEDVASIEGWYNYLYGDNAAANELIKKENPEITDEQIAYTVQTMKDYGLVDSGDTLEKGIGCITDARVQDFYNKMVEAKVTKPGLDLSKVYSTQYTCKGVGMNLKK